MRLTAVSLPSFRHTEELWRSNGSPLDLYQRNTQRVAEASASASPYRLVGDTLYAQFHDVAFADLYHHEGKPALSPVLLALVTIFHALDTYWTRRPPMPCVRA